MSAYFSFYNYICEVLNVKLSSTYNWYEKASEVGLVYPLRDYCVISDRPESIKMSNGRLHCDDAPSITYTDGFSIYSLNGILMKPEYVLTPPNEIDMETVLKEQNIDVRRELIRKVGIERLVNKGMKVDESNGYRLIDMSSLFTGVSYAPFLVMRNPSLEDTFHAEGVGAECQTVEQALNFRKPQTLRDIPVSPDGSDWYQQGDVCIWDRTALTVKQYPKILT